MLAGRIVRLEPLAPGHDDGLWEAARFPEVWTWVMPAPQTRAGFGAYLEAARAAEGEFALATVDASDGTPLGMTRYMALRPADHGIEIGSTWLTPSAWQTGANAEAKLLQLGYAFDTLGCIRVELKTHASNARSRAALERMGATFEGIHRKHRVIPGLGVRDTAWYSVTDDDWPRVRNVLESRLASRLTGSAERC